MTNAEKFEEVFGFKANTKMCYMPEDIECPLGDCDDCSYNKWLEEEYTGASPTGEKSTCDDCKTPCVMYEKGMRGCISQTRAETE